MPALELLPMGDEELISRLAESRRELLNLRFQLATGQLDNSARIGQVRREVARILTVLREREIAEAEGRTLAPVPPRPARSRRASGNDQDESPKRERARRSAAPAETAVAEPPAEEPAVVAEDADVEEEA
jgi:large subunit ribosomal protein L29